VGAKEDRAEDDQIATLTAKVDAQAVKVGLRQGTEFQRAQDRRVLNEMRQNESQARFNRTLSRNADDISDIADQQAAE
jgi:ubiquitin